jgi:hypothetical protein
MPNENEVTHPSISVSRLMFSDDSSLEIEDGNVVVVVGPNNAGKSATLRAIRDKLNEPATESPVLKSIQVIKRGSVEDFERSVTTWARRRPDNLQNPGYAALGQTVHQSQIRQGWDRQDHAVGHLTRWLCHFLSADERLQICNPAGNVALLAEGPSHPIHYLQRDPALESSLSAKFRKAFGADLVVHRNAGNQVPLHVGQKPAILPGEDRVSLSYLERLEALPQLQTQGDGMRSFAGVLLATSVGRESVMLIDEPEAFLHPPQAKLLGLTLVQERRSKRQLFIATHSTDIVRGVLEANSPDVKVLRIQRVGAVNKVRLLSSARIRELWSDPLLRYSNILDGLFHEGVIVCEADSDCRFYAAVLDAATGQSRADIKRPDLMFTHCGGKARLPLVIRALREVGVPVKAVADFDVLSDEQPLRSIVEALGAEWSAIEPDWRLVKSSVDAKRPDLNTADVRREFEGILESVSTPILPERARSDLQSILKRSSAWSNAKLVGRAFVPSGDPARACERLLSSLRTAGLHVVEVGELEGFVRTADGHGPKWVNSVLSRNLAEDPELDQARRFSLALADVRSAG